MMRRLPMMFAFALLWLSVVIIGVAFNRPALAQGENLLANPGFEGAYAGYVPQSAFEQSECPAGICGTAQMPSGWFPWWDKPRSTDVMPEWKPATTPYDNRIHEGATAAQYFTFWRTHHAGLRQTVTVPANALLRLTAWGQAWSSSTNDPFSANPTPVNMRIGIDPTGSGNVYSPAVVWSSYANPYDTYAQFTVEAQAQGTSVTVFLFSSADPGQFEPNLHNDIYWDDASLTVIGSGAPAAPPAAPPTSGSSSSGSTGSSAPAGPSALGPTATPNADGAIMVEVQSGDSLWSIAARNGLTLDELLELNDLTRDDFIHEGQLLIVGYATPESAEGEGEASLAAPSTEGQTAEGEGETESGEATPAATPEPEPTAEAEPKITGGSICLKAFDDANRNGLHDAGEGLRPAVAFTIADGETVVSNYVTDGTTDSYCIEGLPAGNYHITRSHIAVETLTTPGDWAISLADGGTLNLEFGSAMETEAVVMATDAGEENAEVAVAAEDDAAGVAEAAEAVAASAGEEDAGGMISGIAVAAIVVAVLLLVGVLVVILSGRRSSM